MTVTRALLLSQTAVLVVGLPSYRTKSVNEKVKGVVNMTQLCQHKSIKLKANDELFSRNLLTLFTRLEEASEV